MKYCVVLCVLFSVTMRGSCSARGSQCCMVSVSYGAAGRVVALLMYCVSVATKKKTKLEEVSGAGVTDGAQEMLEVEKHV